jgi:hypothetical protein
MYFLFEKTFFFGSCGDGYISLAREKKYISRARGALSLLSLSLFRVHKHPLLFFCVVSSLLLKSQTCVLPCENIFSVAV